MTRSLFCLKNKAYLGPWFGELLPRLLDFNIVWKVLLLQRGKSGRTRQWPQLGRLLMGWQALPYGAKGWCVLGKYLVHCSWWLPRPAFKSQHSELVSRHIFSYSCSLVSDTHNVMLGPAAFSYICGGLCFSSVTSGNTFFCGLWHLYLSILEAFAVHSFADQEF